MTNKIGIGIITCNRPKYLERLVKSLAPCTEMYKENVEVVIVNDGDTLVNTSVNIPKEFCFLIENERNCGVGASKNVAFKKLVYEKQCTDIFLIEDDIFVKDCNVFNKYIEASRVTGIQHFNFAFHGKDNYFANGLPAIRLQVDYTESVSICLYPNVYGAFSMYTKKCIDEVGLMDEFYFNALEHVQHTYDAFKKDMHPPFRWFADITDSNKYIEEIDRGHSGSEIRRDQKWIENFHKAADYFAKKNGFDVRNPYEPTATKDETVTLLKQIKKNYGKGKTI